MSELEQVPENPPQPSTEPKSYVDKGAGIGAVLGLLNWGQSLYFDPNALNDMEKTIAGLAIDLVGGVAIGTFIGWLISGKRKKRIA